MDSGKRAPFSYSTGRTITEKVHEVCIADVKIFEVIEYVVQN
jgi:hypothetical protein